MKNILLFLLASILLTFGGCQKDDPFEPDPEFTKAVQEADSGLLHPDGTPVGFDTGWIEREITVIPYEEKEEIFLKAHALSHPTSTKPLYPEALKKYNEYMKLYQNQSYQDVAKAERKEWNEIKNKYRRKYKGIDEEPNPYDDREKIVN